jgi:hypothetical protein
MSRPYHIALRQFLNLLSVAWLITWITTVPLFHIHLPDTTDRWSALQSRGIHTVFTPALPGEFFLPFDNHVDHLSQRAVNSPELGFTLFSTTDEDQTGEQLSLFGAYDHFSDALLQSRRFEFSRTCCGSTFSHALPAFRAPPCVVSI